MNSAEQPWHKVAPPRHPPAALGRLTSSPRLIVYIACTLLAVLISYALGKDMRWDTLDYHLYAGFSALHDRFNQDYFPAGAQTYFNPYIYAPFYLLATSRLSALTVASILAVIQSAILWLTYDLALEVGPEKGRSGHVAAAACAVLLAFANPILMNQFGSSYADITTAELVLAGWLLLVRAIRSPATIRIVSAGLLLGAASAFKATNAVHALSAFALLPFLPIAWRDRVRQSLIFGAALALSFAVVCAPWSVHLERHFGNPVFPLLNGIFKSPQFPTGPMLDYRFVPSSLAEALWRPFAIVAPVSFVDDELPAPDLRYALLVALALGLACQWAWRRLRGSASVPCSEDYGRHGRALAALGCGFVLDWTLWLAASGNGRYFVAMGCVAAVLGMALVFRAFAKHPKARNYVLLIAFTVQFLQLYIGTAFRYHIPWTGAPWFDLSVDKTLAAQPNLYFTTGEQSNSFVAPFLAPASGFVNLDGDFTLAPSGANGARLSELIQRYSPNLRVLVRVLPPSPGHRIRISEPSLVNDALFPFKLRLDPSDCSKIVARHISPLSSLIIETEPAEREPSVPLLRASQTGYFLACRVIPDRSDRAAMLASEHRADIALDHLEDACPSLFQPRRPATVYHGDERHGDIWSRTYANTSITAWVSHGTVKLTAPMSGDPIRYLGSEGDWMGGSVRVSCARQGRHMLVQSYSSSPR